LTTPRRARNEALLLSSHPQCLCGIQSLQPCQVMAADTGLPRQGSFEFSPMSG
jgi:hypothetical protein